MVSTDKEAELLTFQLQETYKLLDSAYTTVTQWAGLSLTAEAALLGLGIANRSGLLLIMGGIILMIFAYLITRAGQAMFSFGLTALALEESLNLTHSRSLAGGLIACLRGVETYKNMRKLALAKFSVPAENQPAELAEEQQKKLEERWQEQLRITSGRSLFSPTRSLTVLLALALGETQCLIVICLVVYGYMRL